MPWLKIPGMPPVSQWQNGQIKRTLVKGKDLVVVRFKDQFHALPAKCPHAGGPLDGGWCTEQGAIVCPWHRYEFDVCTGKNISGEGYNIQRYAVEQRANGLYIEWPEQKWWDFWQFCVFLNLRQLTRIDNRDQMLQLNQIASLTSARFLQQVSNPGIQHFLLDSRQRREHSKALFFAIRGRQHDGHQYIKELYLKGFRNFIVQTPINLSSTPEANVLQVPDSIQALQQIAASQRQQFRYPVIAITGSNGKTIVKEWLFQMLWQDHVIVRSPKSYNSQIGVPLSLLEMRSHHSLGIFEAGISLPNEMKQLAKMLKCDYGIITNLGSAHDEGFDNRLQKAKEKLQLFQGCKWFVYPNDYPELSTAILSMSRDSKAISWGSSKLSDYQLIALKATGNSTKLQMRHHASETSIHFDIPFTDQASIENLCCCVVFLLEYGLSHQQIQNRLRSLEPVAMRLEMKQGINSCQLINDAYNSDLQSLRIALDFLDQQQQSQDKIVVLSDLLQTGRAKPELYSEVAELLKARSLTEVVTIGPESALHLAPALTHHFQSKSYERSKDFLAQHDLSLWSHATILFKGARKFHFEQIVNKLSLKAHQTRLEINLNAIAHNLRIYRSLLDKHVKVMAMVKSAAYGSGSTEVAKTLSYHKADYLAVAYPDEGVQIRKAGIQLPIMVMNSYPGSFEIMVQNQLEPEIFNIEQLDQFLKALQRSQVPLPYPIHIKLETGMNRLGFGSKDIRELIETCRKANDSLEIKSLMSHLSVSDTPNGKAYSLQQIETFKSLCNTINKQLQIAPLRHILNSTGVVNFPEAHFDMVRLGIGLYGVDPSNKLQQELQTVASLKSFVSQVKTVPAHSSIGYGRVGQTGNEPRIIATIAIGYADGYFRSLSDGKASVLIRGQLAPTIGNICMDMCMVDVSDIPGVAPGDEVLLFGETPSVEQVASWANTIAYELMTSISQRVKRVFYIEQSGDSREAPLLRSHRSKTSNGSLARN